MCTCCMVKGIHLSDFYHNGGRALDRCLGLFLGSPGVVLCLERSVETKLLSCFYHNSVWPEQCLGDFVEN